MAVYKISDYYEGLSRMNFIERSIYHRLGYAKNDRLLASLGVDIEREFELIKQKRSRLTRREREIVVGKYYELYKPIKKDKL